jgi:hypothetical protein
MITIWVLRTDGRKESQLRLKKGKELINEIGNRHYKEGNQVRKKR